MRDIHEKYAQEKDRKQKPMNTNKLSIEDVVSLATENPEWSV